jgi:hypothetical protein
MYDVHDITELVRHHLVLSVHTDDQADANLGRLISALEQLYSQPPSPIEWIQCDGCGAMVTSDLIDEDGAGWLTDGDFNCSSCRFADES